MTISIRPMTELDIDQVYAIEKDAHVAPWSKNILFDCVRVGYDCRVFGIAVDNKQPSIAGYIICRHSNRVCHILNFCLGKSFQSKGYGRAILEKILISLSKLGDIDYVILEVRPSNEVALHLYQSVGFEQKEIKSAYYTDESGVEDAILLQLKL